MSFKYKNSKYSEGFTLAEVLITLVIIGVIAAMTIPVLMKNTEKQEFVTGVKKANSTLSQALIEMARNNDSSPGDYTFLNNTDFIDEFAKVVNVIKKCDNSAGCFPSTITGSGSYKLLNSTRSTMTDGKSCITADGQMFSYNTVSGNVGISTDDINNRIGRIMVDINGHKAPNIVGRDVFAFYVINGKGIVPAGSASLSACANTATTGYSCAARVLKENAMNY